MKSKFFKSLFKSLPVLILAMSFYSCTKPKTNSEQEQQNTDPQALNSSQDLITDPNADIIVGEVGSLTGGESTFGVSTHNGILLAMKEINEAGGIHGRRVNVIALDDQSKPDEAAMAVTRLITHQHAVAILGEVASSRSLAMAPIAQSYKIPMVSPSSTNPKVTEQGDYIFRVCFIDPFQGAVMAHFAVDQLKTKNIAILRDMKSDYSIGLADFFKNTLEKEGGTVVVDQSYTSGDVDFKSQLTSIRSKNPEAIFVPGYYTEVGLIARQARELGITVPLLGGDGWDSEKLVQIGGTALENSYFSNHYSSESNNPKVAAFLKSFEMFGQAPDGLSAMGYDAAHILFEAMKRTKDLDPTSIRDELAKTKDFDGVTGKISLDANRNAIKDAVVLKVDNGQFKYVSTITPGSLNL